jgi:hypothetical protein
MKVGCGITDHTCCATFGGGLQTLLHLHVLAGVRGLLTDQQFDYDTVDVGRVSCH